MTYHRNYDFAELNALLAEQISDLARVLLGPPNRKRSSWKELRYGTRGSLKINLQGHKQGRWRDFEADEGGAPLDLVMREQRFDDVLSAAEWAHDWLGLDTERRLQALPSSVPRLPSERQPEADEETERARKTEYALHLYHEARPLDRTHGAAYLAERGVFVPDGAPIRFHPYLKHSPSGRYLPAIVALVDNVDGRPVGIQRTYLDPDAPRKADVEPAKMSLGAIAGGAVRLTPTGETLAVAEGIETALAVWTATGLPTWAALGTSGLKALELPPEVREVIICADHDESGAGLAAANEAAACWTEEGRKVWGVIPPRSVGDAKGADFADMIKNHGPKVTLDVIGGAVLWTPDAPEEDGADFETGEIVVTPPPLPRGVIEGIEPHFKTEPLDVETAAGELRRAVDGWFDQALSGASPGPRLQIAAAAGLGKTQVVLEALAKRLRSGQFVHYFVPNLALSEEVAKRCQALGLPALVIRGRTAKAPEAPDGTRMCQKPKLAEMIGKLGMNVERTICTPDQGGLCPHIEGCRYRHQDEAIKERGILLFAHNYLTLPKPPNIPGPIAVVVDENPLLAFQREWRLDVGMLGAPHLWGGVVKTADFLETCRRVREALLEALALPDSASIQETLGRHGVNEEDLREALRFANRNSRDTLPLDAGTEEREALTALSDFKPFPRVTVANLLSRILKEARHGRGTLHGIELHTSPKTGKKQFHVRSLAWTRFDQEIPLLAIDANATMGQGGLLWGPFINHLDLPVVRKAVIHQVADHTFAKSSLIGKSTPKAQKTAARLLEKVRRFVFAQVALHGRGRVLVITNKPIRRALTGEDADRLPVSFDLDGAIVTHYGGIRGIDDWKDLDCCIVVGREQLSPSAAEALARGVHCDDPAPLHLPGEYVKSPRGYRVADNTKNAGVEVWVHPEERAQALHEQVRENEVVQAIDRLRLIHRETPANVFILGDLPVDVTLDRLLGFRELLFEAEAEVALRKRGVIPLSAEWLAENEPLLFVTPRDGKPSIRGIKKALQGFVLSDGARCTSLNNNVLYWKGALWSLATFRTRRGGRWRRALVYSACPNHRDALSQTLGEEVIEFRLLEVRVLPDISQSVPIGAVLPLCKVTLPVQSDIFVRPSMGFPELVCWDENGKPRGWNFGLPLPPPNSDETPLEIMPAV